MLIHCTKDNEPTYCWVCTTVTSIGIVEIDRASWYPCDWTESQASAYARGATSIKEIGNNVWYYFTKCIKK